jgi:ribosome-associated toxin RatA of RatAB toxin-antitoxin module
MPKVLVTEHLRVDVEAAWDVVADVARFPELMESVRVIEILSSTVRDDGCTEAVVGWEIELEESVLRWVEREVRDPVTHTVLFDQVSGDLEQFRGHWAIRPGDGGGTVVSLEVDFEIGFPLLRDVLNPFAVSAIENNSLTMLRSLEAGVPAAGQVAGTPVSRKAPGA